MAESICSLTTDVLISLARQAAEQHVPLHEANHYERGSDEGATFNSAYRGREVELNQAARVASAASKPTHERGYVVLPVCSMSQEASMLQSESTSPKTVDQLQAELAEAERIAARVREDLGRAQWLREYDEAGK